MKRTGWLYWTCQICGWGAYSAVGLWTAGMDHGWKPSAIYGYVLFFFYNIGLTHLLRYVIRSRRWRTLPLQRFLMRLALSCLLLGMIQTSLVVGVYTAIEGSLGVWSDKSAIAYLFMGVTIATTIWTALYLTITTMRHAREFHRNQLQMKIALGEAELRALEAQLNPHFLFNCLNSIRGMIVENADLAQDMVTKLANILRYSLQPNRAHTVLLETELGVVSDYLALESIRFDDRLRVRIQMQESVGQHEIPAMLLQTLVENAIKYGVERSSMNGELSIRADIEGARLRIEVENEGSLQNPAPESTQIGMANAQERLRIVYGDSASLNLNASRQGRVTATILIPAR
jgi:two-component system sensor histidine kinase AlgZ